MNSKITIPIAVVISVIVTAGIMYSVGFEQEVQVTQTPQTEIIYVEKTVSDILRRNKSNKENFISRRINRHFSKLLHLFGGNFYDNRSLRDAQTLQWQKMQ